MKPRAHETAAWRLRLLLALATIPVACTASLAEVSQPSDSTAFKLYQRACGHVTRGTLDLALQLLQESFGSGHPHPMQVVSDTCFEALLRDPASRAELRSLLQRHAWDSRAHMVMPHEPGERIRLQVNLYDATTGKAVPRAVVALSQADSQGQYSRENDSRNPRLFAFLMADDSGRVDVETIRPGSYHTSDGVAVPAHVHFTVSGPGLQALSGEFIFSESSATQSGAPAPPASVCVAARLDTPGGPPSYRARITLEPQR